MHPGLEQLIHLQRVEVDLRKLNEELTAIPTRIAALAARSAQAQADLLSIQDTLAKEEKLRRAHESEIKSQHERIGKLEAQTGTVTNESQAAALEHQLAHARTEIARLEDEELRSLERTEAAQPRLAPAQETAAATESNLEAERLAAADRTTLLQARSTDLTAERASHRAAVESINDTLLANYDRISRNRGTAVAEASGQKCSACQMLIRPQRWSELRDRSRQDDLFTCESCGRLLYFDPIQDAPQKKPLPPAPTPSRAAAARKPPAAAPREPRESQDPKDRPDFGTGSIASRIIRGY